MANKYAIQDFNKELMAKALGRSLPISTKQSIEICNFLRNKTTLKAKKQLELVINKKLAIPFKRFNKDIAHRKGNIASGKFPEKASKHFLKLIENAEKNAQNKNLDTTTLLIKHICAHKASTPWHFGRHRRRKMKRTHVEIVVEEIKQKKEDKR